MKKINREDVKNIVEWFAVNKRDLPWRANNNPYAVWISEIMLQQTRVDTVIDKYIKQYKNIWLIPQISSTNSVESIKFEGYDIEKVIEENM